MPSNSPNILGEREWERRKMRIWYLFLQKNMNLAEIRDCMKDQGFCATLDEYRSHIRSWGFSKKNPEQTRNYISHRVEKRKRQGKRSEVVVAGLRWSEQKIQKETCRNFRPTHERLRDASPRTPPGPMVSVCSPIPVDITPHIPFEWPSDLPWLRFTKRASEAPVDILGMMAHLPRPLRSGSSTNGVAIFGGNSTLPQGARYLGIPVPSDMSNPVKMSGHFRCFIPESVPGEHLMRCQESTKNANISARELIMLALHQISNKSIDGFQYGVRRDELLLDLVTQSGLVGLKDPLLEEPTVASILEEIWCAALRCCRVRIVSWILDVSNHLNLSDELVACPFWKGHSHKPLVVVLNHYLGLNCWPNSALFHHSQKVPSHDVEETIRTLLAHRASPDHYCCGVHGTPLEMAIREGFYGIVKLFIEYSIGIHGQEYLRKMDFGNLLRLPRHDISISRQNGMLDYFQSIHAKAFPCSRDLLDALLCPKGLIHAAVKGCPALLHRLRAMGADFNYHNELGEFPLGAVIAHQSSEYTPQCDIELHHRQRCKLLVSLGASLNYVPTRISDQKACPSALHIASFMGHDKIVGFLVLGRTCHHAPAPLCIDGTWLYGLGTEASNLNTDQARSPLSWALSRAHQRCAALLLETGAPVEGHELLLLSEHLSPTDYGTSRKLIKKLIERGAKIDLKNSSGETALDIAIRKGNHEVANILIHVGANINPSISLDWLGYFEIITAEYDEHTIYDGNISLENWFRLYPCESFHSQNARLDACVKVTGALGPLKFVLDRYPHAYTSYALKNILERMGFGRAGYDIFDMPVFPILYDLLKRRRPELVDIAVECEALCEMLFTEMHWERPDLLGIVDMLVSRQPNLSSGMRSNPWANPLIVVFEWRFRRSYPYFIISNTLRADSVLNKFLHHGFRANTALGLVVLKERCSIDQLRQLMALGFEPRKRYRWSHTTLQLAVRSNDLDVVRYLLSCGVKVNGRPRWGYCPRNNFEMKRRTWMRGVWYGLGRTALQVAVENGNWELTELLVSHGADVNAQPARIGGATALQLAAIKGYTGLVGWLISCGAKVHAQGATIKGMTAMEGAAASGRLDVVKLLFEHGNFRSGDGRRQYVRAVGFARRNACHTLRSYMEHQVGWSEADEDMLREEDSNGDISVEEPFFKEGYDSNKDNGDYCQGKQCAGETESIDEEMDEPACCREKKDMELFSSQDRESDAKDFGENEISSPMEAVSTNHEDEASEPCGEGSNKDVWGMGHWDKTEAPAYDGTFDGFLEDQTAADEDWGFLADAGLGYEGPAVSAGVVLGEVTENEEFNGEPWPPAPVPGWTDDFNGQTDWIGYNGHLPGDLMDFSENQVGETQAGNPFVNMNMDQQE